MKMKTTKIIGKLFLFVLLAIGGLVFAASFAVESLQSWPKAIMEARIVLYGQVVLGFILGLANGKWFRWLNAFTLGATVIALCFYTWYMGGLPGGRFGFCLSGMFTYILMGGIIAGQLVREVSRNGENRARRLPSLILAGDSSKN